MGLFKKTEKTAEVKSYCFLHNDIDQMNVLKCNPLFELSTADLIKKGYAGRRVYKYYSDYSAETTLVPEPTNKNDKNAVMILVDGKLFGYVAREEAPAIKKLLKKNAITSLSLTISCGCARKIYDNGQSTADRYDIEPKLIITYQG